jgi:eukaryotic-like serine/threonine-protein kinase
MTDEHSLEGGALAAQRGVFAAFDEENPPVLNPEVGQVLAGIKLVGKLGEGAMATVFRAEFVDTGEPLAVKVLRAELCQNIDAMRRFDKEALAAQSARHPNLIEISDVLHPEGFPPVLVMELLEGDDLHDAVVRKERFTAAEAIPIAIQLCAALGALHGNGIVHRDLKPENVFLVGGADGFPIVKLLDFGLVKFLYGGDAFVHTQPDATIGTPAFMAPEQFDSPAVENTADIYAVGAILYEMLTGRPPVEASTPAEGYTKVMNEDRMPPSTRVADPEAAGITPGVDALVLRCLERKPEDRIQECKELADLLAICLEGGDLVLPDKSRASSKLVPVLLGVALGIAVLGGLMYAVWTS